MPTFTVDLNISEVELARYYDGRARQVLALSRCGKRLRFPADWLRPFVDRHGVHGRFELQTDSEHRLQDFKRLQ